MDFIEDLFDASFSSSEESSSHRSSKGDVSLETYAIGAVLYLLLGLATIGIVAFKKLKLKTKMAGMTMAFYAGLIIFMFCRAMWLVIEYVVNSDPSKTGCNSTDIGIRNLDYFNKIWNRVCFCVFLLVFQLLLFYWIDTIHTTVNVAFAKDALSGSLDFGFITPLARKLITLFSVLIVLLVLVLAIVRVGLKSALCTKYDKTMSIAVGNLDDANNMIISIVFLIYGICLCFYGTKLNCRVQKTSDTKVEGVWVMEVISILLFICFLLRGFMFSYRIIFNPDNDPEKNLPGDLFEVLTYFIPELCSSILILVSVNSKMFRNSESDVVAKKYENEFVDPLLREQQDNEKFLEEEEMQ